MLTEDRIKQIDMFIQEIIHPSRVFDGSREKERIIHLKETVILLVENLTDEAIKEKKL